MASTEKMHFQHLNDYIGFLVILQCGLIMSLMYMDSWMLLILRLALVAMQIACLWRAEVNYSRYRTLREERIEREYFDKGYELGRRKEFPLKY